MKQLSVLIIVVFAALIFGIIYFAVPTVKAVTNKNVLAPAAVFFGGTAKAIYANPLWKAYVVPYQFLWGIGLMGVFAIVWWKLLAPKVPTIRKTTKAPSADLQGAPPPSPPMRVTESPDIPETETVEPEVIA